MSDIDTEGLSPEVHAICRLGRTEPAFSGRYLDHWADGTYHCTCCDQPLFSSAEKFDNKCGWPNFYRALPEAVQHRAKVQQGVELIEARCAQCDAHLRHRFANSLLPSGQRYCINSLALHFHPEPETTDE